MYHFDAYTVNDYYADVCAMLIKNGKETSPRGKRTKELHPTTVSILHPRSRIVTSFGRVVNLPFALVEVLQILGGDNDAQMLSFYNSGIISIQGDGPRGTPNWELGVSRFNAAYGERLRSYFVGTNASRQGPRIDQLEHVIETLKRDPDSRQASIVLSHPGDDNYTVLTNDRACNVYAHAMIRDRKLDWMQVIRSNDAIWGIPYNVIQWAHVMEWVARSLKVNMGNMFIVQDSFHVYEDKYDECAEVKRFDMYDYLEDIVDPMHVGKDIIPNIMLQEMRIRGGYRLSVADCYALDKMYGRYWSAVVQVLNSYAHFKRNESDGAWEWLPEYEELRLPLVRMYCHYRWSKDPDRYGDFLSKAVTELVARGVDLIEARQWLGIAPSLFLG
jgi:thymidylate synthase